LSKKILLMYISENSGHHRACIALEKALLMMDSKFTVKSINSFNYTNPILEKIINRTYMTVIKRKPEVWGYLYDNPVVIKKTRRLKDKIHKYNSAKMKKLIDDFRPDVVVCTQAFPCGIIADLKRSYDIRSKLIGVLTDYAPHSYWVYNNVDAYVVPSEDTGKRLEENGVPASKINPFGIPVDPKFYAAQNRSNLLKKHSLDDNDPVILIMGGGQGLGPTKKLISLLDRSETPLQVVAITGTNKKLYRSLIRDSLRFKKKVVVLEYSEDVHEFMSIASAIMTKPGGITTAEAMAKGLPIIIIKPLPGQEAMNTKFLLRNNMAVKAKDENEAVILLEELLKNGQKLISMGNNMKAHARFDSSLKIAQLITEVVS
jgi:processive 1,2-diacylglycerol beta-glucosyltransferase